MTSTLEVLPHAFIACRLPPDARRPEWADAGRLVFLARTDRELSLILRESDVPRDVGLPVYGPLRALRVAGVMDFGEIGVLATLAGTLARASISLLAISTFDTDYVFVPADVLDAAIAAFRQVGFGVVSSTSGEPEQAV